MSWIDIYYFCEHWTIQHTGDGGGGSSKHTKWSQFIYEVIAKNLTCTKSETITTTIYIFIYTHYMNEYIEFISYGKFWLLIFCCYDGTSKMCMLFIFFLPAVLREEKMRVNDLKCDTKFGWISIGHLNMYMFVTISFASL